MLKIPRKLRRKCRKIFSRNFTEMQQFSQFAADVSDFSSQYGSETSISYTASNLAGKCNIYPAYGDFTHACVFRTYGPWWKYAPSGKRKFKRTPPGFVSQDFIELEFEYAVHPTKIEIWETYNPGTIVRILACDSSGTDVDRGMTRWRVLWEGGPEKSPPESRIFSPPLRNVPFCTKVLRLEFCHDLCEYYTELDAVCLYGEDRQGNLILSGLEGVTSRSRLEDIGNMEEKLNQLSLRDQEYDTVSDDAISIEELPEEVIQLILSYLDIPSLCMASVTSKFFHKHCYDSLQYKELDLQPHWTEVNNFALDSLLSRCHYLQHLNISWCGGNQNCISPATFSRFLKECGRDLQTLYMSSCKFVNGEVIMAVAENCPKLKELDVGSCQSLDGQSISHLSKIQMLERLNLYRLPVDKNSLIKVLRVCSNLRHLNLGATRIREPHMDTVMKVIGSSCKNLISLDLWRCTLTEDGLGAITENCPRIEELDLGWCSNLRSSTGCIIELVMNCPNIKKLYLTANRTICKDDLAAIAKYCRKLEQLDILGTSYVHADNVHSVLTSCPNLIFLDVSFCSNVSEETIEIWRTEYPRCSIKKSFQD